MARMKIKNSGNPNALSPIRTVSTASLTSSTEGSLVALPAPELLVDQPSKWKNWQVFNFLIQVPLWIFDRKGGREDCGPW